MSIEKNDNADVVSAVAAQAKEATKSDSFQAQIYKSIAVQRPVVQEYLRSMRRSKPDAGPADLLKEMNSRYVATVTMTSSGVGLSAAIPGVGIPLALGLGVADLLFFYETSALYVLGVAELHGISVTDPERAKPLVLGTLLGQKSQNQIGGLVMSALGGAQVNQARSMATSAVGKTLPSGWGDVLTQQLPDSALAPLTVLIAREALKQGGKLATGTAGKAIPFGVGAVIGGVGSFTFGRDVVKSAREAFPTIPENFPEWLDDFDKPVKQPSEPSRAVAALNAAASSTKDFGENVWGRMSGVVDAFRPIDLDGDGIADEARALTAAKRANRTVVGAAGRAVGVFRKVDLDGDGVPDEARAVTAAKGAGSAVASAAADIGQRATTFFSKKRRADLEAAESALDAPGAIEDPRD